LVSILSLSPWGTLLIWNFVTKYVVDYGKSPKSVFHLGTAFVEVCYHKYKTETRGATRSKESIIISIPSKPMVTLVGLVPIAYALVVSFYAKA
jgi:hypothetical protein